MLVSVLVAAPLFLLLRHLLFQGVPFSYDAMTYTRSLWGVAHGDFYNPVVSTSALAIHGQFVLLLMAPLAWVMAPAAALALLQAAAFGVLVWLVAGEAQLALFESGFGSRAAGLAALAAALLLVACPLVMNPFLFDVRPDLLAVPLLVAGGLRGVRRGGLDRPAVALLLGSLLVREDFAVVAAAALLCAPRGAGAGMAGRRLRWAAALGALAYLALYLFGIRRLLGGSGLVAGFNQIGANLFNPSADAPAGVAAGATFRFKAEIGLVAIGSLGGLALAGGRWLGMAAPGLAILLGMNRLQPWVLNTHYSMFAAPGLIVAAAAGFRRWARRGLPGARTLIPVGAGAASLAFFLGSALPGGGHYLPAHFWLSRNDRRQAAAAARLARCRGLLATVPRDGGLALPFVLGPPFADRPVIAAVEAIPAEQRRRGEVPSGVRWVALFPPSWRGYGRLLVTQGRFRTAGLLPGEMVLLTHQPGEATSPR